MAGDPYEHRVDSFTRLGYERELAICLAESKDKHGVYVYSEDVNKILKLMVAKGKSQDEALHIAFGIYSDV